jgi:hypothetical protein
MVYGYYISDSEGNQRFFTEGCLYCSMSTGGLHEYNCPMNPRIQKQNIQVFNEQFLESHEENFLDPKLTKFYKQKGYL